MKQVDITLFFEKFGEWPWENSLQFVLIALICLVSALIPFGQMNLFDEVHFVFYIFLFFLASLYRPTWGFLLLVALLPLETTNFLPESFGVDARPYQILTAVLALALIVQLMTKRIAWPLFALSKVDIALGGVFLGSLLAAPQASMVGTAFKETLIIASFGILYGIGRYFLSQTALRIQTLIAASIGAGTVFFVALWQSIAFRLGKTSYMVMEGRPNSTFFEADWLGLFAALVVLASTAGLWYSLRQRRSKRDSKVLIFSLLFFFTASSVLILTVARSAWLAVAVGGAILFFGGVYFVNKGWWKRKLLLKMTLTSSLCFGVASLFVVATGLTRFDISDRLTSTATGEQRITVSCVTTTVLPETISSVQVLESYQCRHIRLEEKESEQASGRVIQEVYREDPNFNTRSAIYQKTFTLIQAHPLVGIGGGNSPSVLGVDAQGAGLNASNLFLETWLSAGLLGLVALTFVFGLLFVALIKEVCKGSEKHLLGLALLFTLIVFNLFNAGMLLGVFFGLLTYLATISEESGHMVKLETDFKIL